MIIILLIRDKWAFYNKAYVLTYLIINLIRLQKLFLTLAKIETFRMP